MRYKYFFTFRSEYYIDAERMYSINFLYYIQALVLQDQTLIPVISKVSVGEDDGTGSDLRLLIDNRNSPRASTALKLQPRVDVGEKISTPNNT